VPSASQLSWIDIPHIDKWLNLSLFFRGYQFFSGKINFLIKA